MSSRSTIFSLVVSNFEDVYRVPQSVGRKESIWFWCHLQNSPFSFLPCGPFRHGGSLFASVSSLIDQDFLRCFLPLLCWDIESLIRPNTILARSNIKQPSPTPKCLLRDMTISHIHNPIQQTYLRSSQSVAD